MFPITGVLVFLLLTVLFVLQIRGAVGFRRAVVVGLLGVLVVGGARGALEWSWRSEPPLPDDRTTLPPVTSETCAKCHESHYASWHRTYHRTMTREATPENVKGDFNEAVVSYNGIHSRMTQRDGRFVIDTVDPAWEDEVLRRGVSVAMAGPPKRATISVDRLVGSHWMQQALHLYPNGRYVRLPLVYHIVEKRWIHINGAFLKPPSPKFFAGFTFWNASCLHCHNTRTAANPYPIPNHAVPGYKTTVGELGISCEACHGASERHVRAHQNPARRLAQTGCGDADPTIVNPARLSVPRSDDVCARCHGAPLLRPATWNRNTLADPFLAGAELDRFWRTCWSEAEMDDHAAAEGMNQGNKRGDRKIDGRFWGDGTPLTTALEYQGMALSACYQNGKGELRCLTCHSMHQADPNHQVKDGMRTNAACYGCHETYRARLAEHTHHEADSAGSLCMNCHMPHHVYSLLDTHRSHRITIPRVRDSLGTGKPHACNLCHLDKSLGWTSDNLHKWYGTKPEQLSEEDRTFASSLLHLTKGDARSRAIVAGAFNSPAAQKASGRDWPGLLLTRVLQQERYEANRYLLHRSLRTLYGPSVNNYNYQGSPAERAAQLSVLERFLEQGPRPDRQRHPALPLTEQGRFADVVNRWLQTRSDPDVYVNE
jgi:predicted CXXCH cytochrome family protein